VTAEIRHGMPEAEYHAHPALSSTGAKRLLKSPALFEWHRTHVEKPKAAFDLGHAVHAKVLGVGAPLAVYPKEMLAKDGAASTADAKNWAADQRAAGKIPVHAHVAEQVDNMAEAVLRKGTEHAALFDQGGDPEVSVFNTDPETGIALRARFDYLGGAAVDLKTTTDATKGGFERAIARFRYDVSRAHYLHTLDPERLEPPLDFWFVAVETEPPYHVAYGVLDPDFVNTGEVDAAKARAIFAACTESGLWPGLPRRAQLFRPPMFHVYDFADSQETDQ
jgi:hypothetical protein